MANPSFPIDPPELPAPTDAPATAEVPHEEVHAALADALGVSADDVKTDAADPNDAPLAKPFTEILAERKAKLDNQTLPRDPSVTPHTGNRLMAFDELAPIRPDADALRQNVWASIKNAGVQATLAQAAAEQEQATLPGIESGAASPGPGPFADRAAISQRLKRQLRTSVMPEIEGEGLDHLAQIVARIMTTHDAENARAAWNDLARLCDDVAAALR